MTPPDFDRRELLVGSAAAAAALSLAPDLALAAEQPLTRIAFGSCAKQDKEQPIWNQVNAWKPELFIFLGDNIYADTEDMAVMRAKYDQLAAKPGFQQLRRQSKVVAIWDDHDYGKNDAGREYPKKQESKDIFLDFWGEPADSPRRKRPGNHMSYVFGPKGKRVQVILPDNRWWRSGLIGNTEVPKDHGPYLTNTDPNAVMLGREQWQWLTEQLRIPAEIRIFASSTQVLADAPGWETWALFQAEQQRLFDLIDFTGTTGLFCISGDTHYAELSKREDNVPYPMWDMTSSGLTETWAYVAPNKYRLGEGHDVQNFGRIEIDWSGSEPRIQLGVDGVDGKELITQTLHLSELKPKRG